ncbi:MAG TPA: hypothetical protein P5250_07650, partial [Bacteroidales bacterium]|nr:hypothetical protein [Bacteroidales bacterium]
MYKIKLIITQIIFVVLYLSITIAQPTVISGVAYNAMGKKIHLVTYEDYISNNLLELSSTVIDTAGKFTMEVPLSSTCYASIQIDEYVADIYLKPHKKIIINIAPEQYDEGVAYLFQPKLLNITFSEIPPDDINLLIYEFNLIYDNFIHDNFKKIYYKRNFNIVDSFNLCISNKYNNINDNYFLDYVKYKMANFELITRRKSKSDIIKTYFDPENIKYNNAAYMEFFNTFFDGYFNGIAGKIDEVELV